MKRRAFLQNKLWRDLMVEAVEMAGSVIHWQSLDDRSYDQQLRLKLIEEAHEVQAATDLDECAAELADLLEVIDCLSSHHGLSMAELHRLRHEKKQKRGSFTNRKYVKVVEHLEGGPLVDYCLAQPDRYPEIDISTL